MLSEKFKKQKGLKLFVNCWLPLPKGVATSNNGSPVCCLTLEKSDITTGPMFATSEEKAMSIAEMDAYFIPTLLAIQQKKSHIILLKFYSRA